MTWYHYSDTRMGYSGKNPFFNLLLCLGLSLLCACTTPASIGTSPASLSGSAAASTTAQTRSATNAPALLGMAAPMALIAPSPLNTATPVDTTPADATSFREVGLASWYGKKFHGRKTYSGERYDMAKLTAAHLTLPIASYARVTNLRNGRWVIVKINDRGPHNKNRVMDLSYAAAKALHCLDRGIARVEVRAVTPQQRLADGDSGTLELAMATPTQVNLR